LRARADPVHGASTSTRSNPFEPGFAAVDASTLNGAALFCLRSLRAWRWARSRWTLARSAASSQAVAVLATRPWHSPTNRRVGPSSSASSAPAPPIWLPSSLHPRNAVTDGLERAGVIPNRAGNGVRRVAADRALTCPASPAFSTPAVRRRSRRRSSSLVHSASSAPRPRRGSRTPAQSARLVMHKAACPTGSVRRPGRLLDPDRLASRSTQHAI